MTLTQLLCAKVPRQVGTCFFAFYLEKCAPMRMTKFTQRELFVVCRIINNEPF